MTSPGKECLNVEGAKESGARSKRQTRPTQKALQSAVELKRKQIHKSRKRLLSVMQSAEGLSDESHIDTVVRDLTLASEEFGGLLQELIGLYEQDSHGDYLEEAQLSEENKTLNRALLLLDSLKNRITRQSNKLLETRSVFSRRSLRHSSAPKTSSTTARLQVLAEAKAAREEAQYARLIAQKELERRTREAEAQKIRQQEIAQFDKEIAILGADKKAAMANAKFKVFEEALLEKFELPELEVPKIKAEERASQWVHSNSPPTRKVSCSERNHEPLSTPEQIKLPLRPAPKERKSEKTDLLPELHVLNLDLPQEQFTDEDRVVPRNTIFNRQPLISSTPLKDITGSQLIDSLTVANQQIVACLARQNLPKCQPDVFSGDPTLFHPWKTAFKAMLLDPDVSPTQEINYLRSFTSGKPQRLVDNYRKRQMRDPVALLKELWEELEKRFGSVAVISNTL